MVQEDLEVQVDFDHNTHLILDCSHQCNPLVFDCRNHIFHHNHNHHRCNPHICSLLNYKFMIKKQEMIKCRNQNSNNNLCIIDVMHLVDIYFFFSSQIHAKYLDIVCRDIIYKKILSFLIFGDF